MPNAVNNTVNQWLDNRVGVVSNKSTGELSELNVELNSRAFLIAKMTKAKLLNEYKSISDAFSRGEITMTEAQEAFRKIGDGSQDAIAQSLMRRSRATSVLQTQRQMARGVAEYKSMQDNKEDFPFLVYHTSHNGFVRPSHAALDGNVYSVDDPFLASHMPGSWDYNCHCHGEYISRKKAERLGKIQPLSKAEDMPSESGFSFNPANAFKENDITTLKDKGEIVNSMAEAVRSNKIRKIGLIVESPLENYQRADMPELPQMTKAMEKIQPVAQSSADKAGWDYRKLPNYKEQDKKFKENNPAERNKLPEEIKKTFPGEIKFGKVSAKTCKVSGMGDEEIPITLEVGNDDYGLNHNWIHHKEVFVNPAEGERILKATLGNPRAQVSVTFEKQVHGNRTVFRKIITFFDPKTKSYAVAQYDEKAKKFRLMSYHRSEASYGESQWEVKGFDDRKNQRDYYQTRHKK